MKWGIAIAGGAAFFGAIAYFATRPAAAADKKTLPGPQWQRVNDMTVRNGGRYAVSVQNFNDPVPPEVQAALALWDQYQTQQAPNIFSTGTIYGPGSKLPSDWPSEDAALGPNRIRIAFTPTGVPPQGYVLPPLAYLDIRLYKQVSA